MEDAERGNLNHLDMKPVEFYTRVRDGFKEFGEAYPVSFVKADQPPHLVFKDFLEELTRAEIVS